MIFMKRQDLHRILYAHVKNKDKILTGKRVEEVITATNGVMVKTRDGETFTGDILIGADGIHSRVRREMWRLAAESRPGWFPENELNSEAPFFSPSLRTRLLTQAPQRSRATT